MPITPKHAFKEKSTKLLVLLPLRTIWNRTFQCETPCNLSNEPLSNDLRKTEISEIKEPPVALPGGSLSEITNKYLVA